MSPDPAGVSYARTAPITCPACGHALGRADAPLLLYSPSPSQGEGRGGGSRRD